MNLKSTLGLFVFFLFIARTMNQNTVDVFIEEPTTKASEVFTEPATTSEDVTDAPARIDPKAPSLEGPPPPTQRPTPTTEKQPPDGKEKTSDGSEELLVFDEEISSSSSRSSCSFIGVFLHVLWIFGF